MNTAVTVSGKKILVVDDDQAILEVIMFILGSEGFTVTGINNGQAVVALVQDTKPDLILLDIQLGDRDGRDICRELKRLQETQHIPIIMISANNSRHALQEKNCEAEDFLAKPFDITDLIDHVRHFAA